ncbi:MAG: LPXTG-motif cell wall-anchored protein [Candidatus Paceibacteria bacterium]|jgi:LPXTG-motif cell wall-anchored protein
MKQKIKKYFPSVLIAVVLVQTLAYKFTGHSESVDLFTKIGLFNQPEAFGRIGVGVIELLVSIGIFIKPLRKISLVGVILLMLGAVYFHFTSIGFEGNNLALFISGLIALLAAGYLLYKKK